VAALDAAAEGPRSPTRCSWPTNSDRSRGRIRAASGWRSGGGLKRASGLAPPDRGRAEDGIAASLGPGVVQSGSHSSIWLPSGS
jgi:hypothetical protein